MTITNHHNTFCGVIFFPVNYISLSVRHEELLNCNTTLDIPWNDPDETQALKTKSSYCHIILRIGTRKNIKYMSQFQKRMVRPVYFINYEAELSTYETNLQLLITRII